MLINRIKILDGESLASYLYRLAGENYYDSPLVFLDVLGVSEREMNQNLFNEHAFAQITELSSVSKELLYRMTINSFLDQWSPTFLDGILLKSKIKYCPSCINDEKHHQLIWMLRPVTVCLKHDLLLVDRCGSCGSEISMANLMENKCNQCGSLFDASVTQSIKTYPYLKRSQQEIQNWIYGSGKDLLNHSFKEYIQLANRSFHLLEGLYSFVEPRNHLIQVFPNQKKVGLNNLHTAVALANVYWMYQHPDNFHAVLRVFQSKHHDIRYMQKKEFENLFRTEKFNIIQQWYEQFWLEQIKIGSIRKNFSVFKENYTMLEQRTSVSKEEVKNKWRITSQRLSRLQNNGSVKMIVVRNGKYKRYMINKDSIIRVKLEEQKFISRIDAAKLLGIHVNTFRKLTDMKIVSPKMTPSGVLQIEVSDVERLLEQCRGKYVHNPRGISLYDATQRYRSYGLNLAKLIGWIQSGKVQTVTNHKHGMLSNIFIPEQELDHLLRAIKDERKGRKGYYLEEVMRMLGVGEATIHKMIHRGILVPDCVMSHESGRGSYSFDKTRIDTFHGQHIRLAQASALYNVPRHRLHQWLEKGMLKNYSQGITRRPLLLKAEIENLINKIK